MAKKKKNKKNKDNKVKSWLYEREDFNDSKKGKKGNDKKSEKKGKNKKEEKAYNGPKLLRVAPTLSKKEVAAVHRAARKLPKISNDVLEPRETCNHCQPVLSVAEFKENYESYVTPNLDAYVEVFGEQNVAVCDGCFDALLDAKVITLPEVKKSFLLTMGTIDHLTANIRMDKKEIKHLKSAKESISATMRSVLPLLRELREAQAEKRANTPAGVGIGGATPVGSTQTNGGGGLSIPEGAVLS